MSHSSEKIDYYDANLNHLGSLERDKVHEQGLWHRTFHCWIVSKYKGGSVLFQMRAPSVKYFPNVLDISSAGHILAGEDSDQGIRELKEELGLSVRKEDLINLGYRTEAVDFPQQNIKNREYQSVNFYYCDLPLLSYKPQIEEVSGLFWMKIEDGYDLFFNKRPFVTLDGIKYSKTNNKWIEVRKQITKEQFLPRISNYYLTVCIMAQRLIDEKFPLSIS